MNPEQEYRFYLATMKKENKECIRNKLQVISNAVAQYSFAQSKEWKKIRDLATTLYEKNRESSSLELAATEGYWPLGVAVDEDLTLPVIKPTLSVELSTGRIMRGIHSYALAKEEDLLRLATKLEKLDAEKIIENLESMLK